jgi:hypothetical protein
MKRKSSKRNATANRKPSKRLGTGVERIEDDGLSLNQRRFLAAYKKAGIIAHAARLARITRDRHFCWMREDYNYVQHFYSCQEEAIEALEEECRRRAMSGSDVLLIFMLKASRPDVYRDNKTIEMKGSVQGKVTHEHVRGLNDDERATRLLEFADRIQQQKLGLVDSPGANGVGSDPSSETYT